MASLAPIDHLIAALCFVAAPIWGFATRHHLARAVAAGKPDARVREYFEVIALLALGTALTLGWWLVSERPFNLLRLTLPTTTAALVGVLAALLACGLLVRQLVIARTAPERLRSVLEQLRGVEGVVPLIPRSGRERALYRWVSLAAGVGEELIYRGFGLWYASQFMPPWLAVVATSAVFGFGHAYQGLGGVLRTGGLALAFGAAALGAGTVLPLMVLHTTVDLVNGELVSLALDLRDRDSARSSGSTPEPPRAG